MSIININKKMSSEINTSSKVELLGITTPWVIDIIMTIKAIQKRMKDPDVVGLEYIRVYDKLGKEFPKFFDENTKIFTKVIRGDNFNTIGPILYYQDQIAKGNITESELSNLVADKFLTKEQKAESDAKIKEMRESGKI